MSFLCDSNLWHWYCCCYCCCNPLNDLLDNFADNCCCCFFPDSYDREDNSIDDDIGLDIVVGESLITFDFESDDDSLDDEEYYEIYPYCTRKDTINQLDIKLSKTVEYMEKARNLLNEKRHTMTKEDFYDIRDYYFQALISSPEQFKRKIIKEYERFINFYDYEKKAYGYAVQKALSIARDTAIANEVRCEQYRYAIVNTAEMDSKKDLKREYNNFIRYK